MPDESLPELTLNIIADFHRQLLRLHAAGLRIQLDDRTAASPGPTTQALAARLNEIMAGLASQQGPEQSLGELIRTSSFVPERYRLALETWHGCNCSVESLAMLRTPVQQANQRQADLRYALILPSIILTLIYCASFYLLLVILPRIEAVYAQLDSPPSLPVYCLVQVREAMPYWVPGIPIVFCLLWFMLIAGYWSLPTWLLGRGQSCKYLASALVARNLAVQIEKTQTVKSGAETGLPADGSSLARTPMLRWALSTSSGPEPAVSSSVDVAEGAIVEHVQQARRLRLTANLYETMQTIHAQRLRLALTLFGCIVLGGGMTLMYALALFGPMVQLLKDIVGH